MFKIMQDFNNSRKEDLTMNYIKRLQKENEELKAEAQRTKDAGNEFRRHLNSSKFHKDTTIQVGDVHNWLDIVEGKDVMTLMDKSNNAEGCNICKYKDGPCIFDDCREDCPRNN